MFDPSLGVVIGVCHNIIGHALEKIHQVEAF